jgi:hypothetical protein
MANLIVAIASLPSAQPEEEEKEIRSELALLLTSFLVL